DGGGSPDRRSGRPGVGADRATRGSGLHADLDVADPEPETGAEAGDRTGRRGAAFSAGGADVRARSVQSAASAGGPGEPASHPSGAGRRAVALPPGGSVPGGVARGRAGGVTGPRVRGAAWRENHALNLGPEGVEALRAAAV